MTAAHIPDGASADESKSLMPLLNYHRREYSSPAKEDATVWDKTTAFASVLPHFSHVNL